MGSVSRTPVRFVRTGTVIPKAAATQQNVQIEEPYGVPVRSYSTPAAGESPPRRVITTATESGKARVHRNLHVKTAQPSGLELCRFVAGQQGVVAVPVVGEDRVVVAPHSGGVYAR